MTNANKDRIARLEAELADAKAENAKFEARLSALEPKHAPVRREPPIEGVKVSHPAKAPSLRVPSDAELHKLRENASRIYPPLWSSDGLTTRARVSMISHEENELAYIENLRAAMAALSVLGRLPSPDTRRGITHWMDTAEDYLRSIGKSCTLRFAPFMVAVICSDCTYSGLFMDGYTLSLGLVEYDGRAPDPEAWSRVIETGQIPAAAPVARLMVPASPSHVRFG